MEFRELVSHGAILVRMRAKVKKRIRGIMLMKGYSNNNNNTNGISNSHPFSIQYNKKLRKLNSYNINSCQEITESLDNQIRDVSKKILLIAKQDVMAKSLMTIAAIGYILIY